MPKIEKTYPNTAPTENPYTHDWVQRRIDEFLEKGGKVKQLPAGATSLTLQTDEEADEGAEQ